MIKIGANVTCSQIVYSELVRQKAPALAKGARKLGSKQIRNMATIAGNVVRAQPAADTAVPLTALGAKLEIVSADGARTMDILDAYGDSLAKSNINRTSEVLTFLYVPVQEAREEDTIASDTRHGAVLHVKLGARMDGNLWPWT